MVQISVIVPIHNLENQVERCLSSLVNQDFDLPYEVICLLDSSNTKTYEICRKYHEEFPRTVSFYTTTLFDPGKVRNFGISKATGDYILFVDGDDFVEKNCLSTLFINAKRYNADLVMANHYLYNFSTMKRKSSGFFRKLLQEKVYDSVEIAYAVVRDFSIRGFIWNKLFKKDLIVKNDLTFIPTKYAIEDRPFLLECCLSAKKIYICNDKTYNYVQNQQSYVRKTNRLGFLQRALNCDFVLKIILYHHGVYDEGKFKNLLVFHLRGIHHEANKIKFEDSKEKKILFNEIYKQKLVITGSDLYVYDAPWEKAVLALNFQDNSFYRRLPESFQINDLTKVI